MNSRQSIRAYLGVLASHLGALDRAEADEVVREIESHIHDALDQADARGGDVDVNAVLKGFGSPESLAAQYVAHVRTGAPPPSGFRVIQRVARTATRGLYYAMGAFGYSVAGAFLLLAVAKLLHPSRVGMWSARGGESITIAWSGSPQAGGDELLGYGLLPIALIASAWCAELTRRVLRVLRRAMP